MTDCVKRMRGRRSLGFSQMVGLDIGTIHYVWDSREKHIWGGGRREFAEFCFVLVKFEMLVGYSSVPSLISRVTALC